MWKKHYFVRMWVETQELRYEKCRNWKWNPRFYFFNLDIVVLGVVVLGFTTLETSLVISVAFDSEREKFDKFCSEALISPWGSFTCRKCTTRDPWLYFSSEGSHTQDFYSLKKSIDPGRVWTREPRDHRGRQLRYWIGKYEVQRQRQRPLLL